MDIPGLPQIPTDNLYKFRAVAGLTVSIVALLALGWLWWQLQLQRTATAEIVASYRYHEERVQELTAARQAAEGRGGDSSRLAAIDLRIDSLSGEFERLRLSSRREDARWDSLSYTPMIGVAILLLLAANGLYFTRSAFRDWNRKHQEFQDRLLFAEAIRAEREAGIPGPS